MELCVTYAREKNNLGVERIADRMGVSSHFTLYKWMENGRLPTCLIIPFEHACGINFISQYLAHSQNHLLIPMPTGKAAEHREISELSLFMNETAALLYKHADGEIESDDVISNLTQLMESLAHHRGNVEKEKQPELEL